MAKQGLTKKSIICKYSPHPASQKRQTIPLLVGINEQGILHDFTKPLKQETTLYAKYDIDYKTLVNLVSTTMMSSHVQIEVTIYNMGGFLGLTKKKCF